MWSSRLPIAVILEQSTFLNDGFVFWMITQSWFVTDNGWMVTDTLFGEWNRIDVV